MGGGGRRVDGDPRGLVAGRADASRALREGIRGCGYGAGRARGVSAGHHRAVAEGVGLQSAARGGLRWARPRSWRSFRPRRGPGGARAGPGRHAVDARVAGALPGQGLHRPALVGHRVDGPAAVGPARTGSSSASRSVAVSRRVRTAPIVSLGPGSSAPLSSLSSRPWIGRPGACRPKSAAASSSSARAGACRGSSRNLVHRVLLPWGGLWRPLAGRGLRPLPRTAGQKKARIARANLPGPAACRGQAAGWTAGEGQEVGSHEGSIVPPPPLSTCAP